MLRSELKEVIGRACDKAGVDGEARERLVGAADLTDRIAVGDFQIRTEGAKCGCPATVAGYWITGDQKWDGCWAEGTPESVRSFPGVFDTQPEFMSDSREVVKTGFGGEYITVTDVPEIVTNSYKVATKHPNGIEGPGEQYIVPCAYEAESPEVAARLRLKQLGAIPENTPVLIRVEDENEEFTYFYGTIEVGGRTLLPVE